MVTIGTSATCDGNHPRSCEENVFTTNEQKLAQMMDDPPVVTDGSGNVLRFIDAEKLFPNDALPDGGVRYRFRAPEQNGTPGAVFEFTFKSPPQRRFSFGFRVSTAVR